jgi:hypothetical protein
MFRWDPRAGPTWIHDIRMGPTLGGTHTFLVCGAHNSIVGFMIKSLG